MTSFTLQVISEENEWSQKIAAFQRRLELYIENIKKYLNEHIWTDFNSLKNQSYEQSWSYVTHVHNLGNLVGFINFW